MALNLLFNRIGLHTAGLILSYPNPCNDHSGLISAYSRTKIESDALQIFTIYDMLYLLTAIGLTPGGSSTVHIYTNTIHRTTQNKKIHRTTQTFWNSVCRAPFLRVLPWNLPYN